MFLLGVPDYANSSLGHAYPEPANDILRGAGAGAMISTTHSRKVFAKVPFKM
jgi:hypothetical protein